MTEQRAVLAAQGVAIVAREATRAAADGALPGGSSIPLRGAR